VWRSRFVRWLGLGSILAHPVFVATDVFPNDSPSLEGERTCHDVVEKPSIVADNQHRACEFRQARFEQFQRFDIEIIGRLV
jgi:hypothetical protein